MNEIPLATDIDIPTSHKNKRELLSHGAVLDYDVHVAVNHMSGVAAHWGYVLDRDRLTSDILRNFNGDASKITEGTGFTHIYRTPEGLRYEEAVEMELAATNRAIQEALRARNWLPEHVEAIAVGCGSPLRDISQYADEYYADILIDMNNLHNIPLSARHETYAACNSGGHELVRVLKDPNLQGRKVLLPAIEGLTRLFKRGNADHDSQQVFSNGTAVLCLVPGEDLRFLHGVHNVIRDPGALAAVPPYEHLMDPVNESADNLWQEHGRASMLHLPKPEHGNILMEGMPTAKFFIKNVSPIIADVIQEHKALYGKNIDHYVSHHASFAVGTGVKNRLSKKFGVDIDIPWVIPEGNSSGATTLIAFVRQMEHFKPGDHVMVMSFGAGASFDIFVIECGM